jgi:hypothetical protein
VADIQNELLQESEIRACESRPDVSALVRRNFQIWATSANVYRATSRKTADEMEPETLKGKYCTATKLVDIMCSIMAPGAEKEFKKTLAHKLLKDAHEDEAMKDCKTLSNLARYV